MARPIIITKLHSNEQVVQVAVHAQGTSSTVAVLLTNQGRVLIGDVMSMNRDSKANYPRSIVWDDITPQTEKEHVND